MVMPTMTTTIKLTISIKQNPTIPEMPNLSKREIKYVFDEDDDVCDDDDDDDKMMTKLMTIITVMIMMSTLLTVMTNSTG